MVLVMVLTVALAGAALAVVVQVAGRPRGGMPLRRSSERAGGRISRLTEPRRLPTRW